eukprot:TRINITY_DN382_c1_g2_i1.p1 TRINITY_DN382_c1_g2~~TRINITY_DN382_c1_g2_i1.p1  ORF type:complete len:332 (+),score=43.01 TRINITY_DN382_c1_g2_i1:39-998(+)
MSIRIKCVVIGAALMIWWVAKKEKISDNWRSPSVDDGGVQFLAFTDVHYAAGDDRINGAKKVQKILKEANREKKTAFAAILGDLKDEGPGRQTREGVLKNLDEISKTVAKNWAKKPVFWVIGNHDVDRLTKAEYKKAIGLNTPNGYYSSTTENLMVIVLDTGFFNETHEWDCLSCATGSHVGWNISYVPAKQRAWLRDTLMGAEQRSLRVVILSHARLDPPVTPWEAQRTSGNADQIRSLLSSPTVALVLSGHDHRAAHSPTLVDRVPYLTIPALVDETDMDSLPFAQITVSNCEVFVKGHGRTPSFRHNACKNEWKVL